MAIRSSMAWPALTLAVWVLWGSGCFDGGGGTTAGPPAAGGALTPATPAPAPTPTPVPTPTPTPSPVSINQDATTYHADTARTGLYRSESILTPTNVTPATFGLKAILPTDGKVDAQPLFASAVSVPGSGARNVVFAVTEHDSAYAFDADSGQILWSKSALGTSETPSDARNCDQVTPEIGITSTPVIDRTRGANGALYLVAMSRDGAGAYHQRLHALDLATGAELFGGPTEIRATYPGSGPGSSGGMVAFDPAQYEDRAALLLSGGVVYTAWSSHCDIGVYQGWVIGYDAATLRQTSVANLTPNGSMGAIWMAGDGLQADAAGYLYFLDGNGTFDGTLDANGFPANRDFGNAFVKLSASGGSLTVADYFATYDTIAQSNADNDLGSGGSILLPDLTDGSGTVKHLAVGAGKDANIYVVDRDNMGKYAPTANNANAYQVVAGVLGGGSFAVPAYYAGTLYYGASGDSLRAIPVSNARLAGAASSHSVSAFPYPGTTPAISANGSSNAIVWAVENASPAVLHAYDAGNLATELYNSNLAAGGRDHFGAGNKFVAPMVAGGRVYVGTQTGVAVFGLF